MARCFIPAPAGMDPLRHSDRFISRCKTWYAVVEGGAMKRTPVSTQEGARDHETAVAPEPVHPRPRTSRGVVAPSGFVADAVDRHPLLRGSGEAGRDGAVRFYLPCRSAGARRRRDASAAQLA